MVAVMLNCCGWWTVLVVWNLAVEEERRVHDAPLSSSCPDSKEDPVRCWVDVRLNLCTHQSRNIRRVWRWQGHEINGNRWNEVVELILWSWMERVGDLRVEAVNNNRKSSCAWVTHRLRGHHLFSCYLQPRGHPSRRRHFGFWLPT